MARRHLPRGPGVLACVALLLAACEPPPPAARPPAMPLREVSRATPALAPAPPPDERAAPPVQPAVTPPAPPPSGAPALSVGELAPWFAALFTMQTPTRYTFVDDVDPHDAEGPPFRSGLAPTVTVTCRSAEPIAEGARLQVAFSCVDQTGEAFASSFIATREGLFRAGGSGPPDIPADGGSYRIAYDDGDAESPAPCVRRGARYGDATYCVTTQCRPTIGYGPSVERYCVSRRGLVEYVSENVEGPRIRRLSTR